MKHTPGPWTAHGLAVYTEENLPHWITPRDPAPRYVGHAQWSDMWADHTTEAALLNLPDYPEAEANARLMAASPDLLAMAAELVRLVDDGITPQIIRGQLREEQDFHALVRRAREAVDRLS